jgi:hypothetical protein
VVVLAFDGDQFAATSYGATKAKCAAVGRWIDDLSDRLSSGELPAPRLRSDNPLQEIDNPTSNINGLGVRELHELRVFRPSNGLGARSDNLCRDAFPCAVCGSDNLSPHRPPGLPTRQRPRSVISMIELSRTVFVSLRGMGFSVRHPVSGGGSAVRR